MNFSEKMKDLLDKGIVASKNIATKAASQAQAWGEMGVLKVEVVQLRNQREKLCAKLGADLYARLSEKGTAFYDSDSVEVKESLAKIKELDIQVDEKEAHFKKLGGKEDDLENE